jgi:hypothetical protein
VAFAEYFLVDPSGKVLHRWKAGASLTNPTSREIIEMALPIHDSSPNPMPSNRLRQLTDSLNRELEAQGWRPLNFELNQPGSRRD